MILYFQKKSSPILGHLIFTTQKESPKKCEKILLHEDVLEHHPTVLRGIMIQKLNLSFEEENLILGVDPGQMGLSMILLWCRN